MRQQTLAACVLGLSQVLTVLAVDIPTCVPSCAAQVRAQFLALKCTDANEASCLCAAPGFLDGIQQCSQPTCGATEAQVASYLTGDFCSAVGLGGASKSASSSAAPAASSSSVAPTSTSSAQSSTSTSAAASTTSIATTSASTTSSATSQTSTEMTATSTTGTTDLAAATTTSSTATGDKDSDDQGDEQNNGLSHAAVIGIAVGCTAAGVAILAVIACLLLRRRRTSQPKKGPQISKPIVGSGRTAVSPDPGSYEKYGNDDIEMHTHRYEDMPPQQTPRTMV